MPATNPPIRVAVIAGSRRPNRRSRAVAEWVCQEADIADCELTLVDLDEVALPALAEPGPAMTGEYTLQHTREWSALIRHFDAYVLVTPEYNHSTSAVLKDALDHLYHEWRDKAVGFVGYGTDGGVRAVEHLRGITAELGLAGVSPSVALSIFDDFDADGVPRVGERQRQQLVRMFDALRRWAGALREVRNTPSPASQPAHADLDARFDRAAADAVAEQLVARLQRGLDEGDADLYDSMFAEDVLWGTPYGDVLAGYAPLNTAHRSMMHTPQAGTSRYEIVQSSMPADGVVTTHVRRTALGRALAGGADFSEMALYVLVRRDGRWWLAAGQNTPVRDKPA